MPTNRAVMIGTAACALMGACAQFPDDPTGVGVASSAVLQYPSNGSSADYVNAPATGIVYKAGPVLSGVPKVYLIYYGGVSQARQDLMTGFVTALSGSPLANVLTLFSDNSNLRPAGGFTVVPKVLSSSLRGTVVTPDVVPNIIADAGGDVEDPTTTAFVIIGGPGINAHAGYMFCQQVCGWHNVVGTTLATLRSYAFVGDPSYCRTVAKLNSCNYEGPNAPPNPAAGSTGLAVGDNDAMITVLWHELAETVTDPTGGAYQPEVGDTCNHGLAATSTPVGFAQPDPDYSTKNANGGWANVHFTNGMDYHVQPIWQNAQGGGCVRRVELQKPSVSMVALHGTGDFDTDYAADLVVRNSSTETVGINHFDVLDSATGIEWLPNFPDNGSHQIYGIFDFDHDNKTDILWRRLDNGQLRIWSNINGNSITEHYIADTVDPDWQIKAVGDFNGDGFGDILFQNLRGDGTHLNLAVHYGDAAFTSFDVATLAPLTPAVPTAVNADTVGAGDFDGDHHADVLWHNLANDSYFYWTFNHNSTTYTSHAVPLQLPITRVLGLADVLGTGEAKILAVVAGRVRWINPVDGLYHDVEVLPSPEWRYVGASSWLGVYCQVFWYNRRTSEISRWVLDENGVYNTSYPIVSSMSFDDDPVGF